MASPLDTNLREISPVLSADAQSVGLVKYRDDADAHSLDLHGDLGNNVHEYDKFA